MTRLTNPYYWLALLSLLLTPHAVVWLSGWEKETVFWYSYCLLVGWSVGDAFDEK